MTDKVVNPKLSQVSNKNWVSKNLTYLLPDELRCVKTASYCLLMFKLHQLLKVLALTKFHTALFWRN